MSPKTTATPSRRRTSPARLWDPSGEGIRVRPRPTDTYVVVDERSDRVVTLAVARWPRLDRKGRLLFSGPSPESDRLFVAQRTFERAVGEARRRHKQLRRELRIGDAFLVRGLQGNRPDAWGDIWDVTGAAREAAKIALYAAAARPVSRRRAQSLSLEAKGPPPVPRPRAGVPVARPVI